MFIHNIEPIMNKNRLLNCIDDLMANYPLETNEDIFMYVDHKKTFERGKTKQHGGNQVQHFPNGGFPPIYICESKEKEQKKDSKRREYKTVKGAVSIKQVMEERRKVKPFFVI